MIEVPAHARSRRSEKGIMTEPLSLDAFYPGDAPLGARSPAACGADRALAAMPALYREEAGAWGPLARAAIETAREAWPVEAEPGRAIGPVRPPAAGSTAALRRFLAAGGPEPDIVNAMAVDEIDPPGMLRVVRAASGSAVVFWPAGTDPARADPARIPSSLLPVGVRLQVVLLAGPRPTGRISGERFRGVIHEGEPLL